MEGPAGAVGRQNVSCTTSDRRLDAMRSNPRDKWTIKDIEAVDHALSPLSHPSATIPLLQPLALAAEDGAMGLLDQVLGQVIGQMGGARPGSGGGMGTQSNPLAPHRPGGLPPGSGVPPQGMPQGQGGGLGDLLGGNLPPIALAILALLASKNLKSGAGGYGSVLHDMLAGRTVGSGETAMPTGSPPSGDIFGGGRGGGGGGGFLDQVGGMLGGAAGGPLSGSRTDPAGRVGDPGSGGFGGGPLGGGLGGGVGGGLGGLLGGLLGGGALSGGLGNLLEQFSQNGLGDKANSWVGHGENEPVHPEELGSALGGEAVNDLSQATGLDRGDLLSQLSQVLPGVVDRLTPHGRLPTQDEESGWV